MSRLTLKHLSLLAFGLLGVQGDFCEQQVDDSIATGLHAELEQYFTVSFGCH